MKKLLLAVLTVGLLSACTQQVGNDLETQGVKDGNLKATVTVKGFTPANSTRTVVDEDGSVWWKTGDRMGMFAHDVTIEENSYLSQTALTLAGVLDTHSAAFTGGIGWQMLMDGKHKYFAYYPYNVNNTHDEIVLEYPTKYVFSSNDSREHLGQYDYMYSKMVSPINKERAAFEFEHINALAKFNLAIPEGYRDRKFTRMTITADDSIFTETATYSVSSIVAKGEPEFVQASKTKKIEIEFSGDGVSATDGTLTTWLMMLPAQCSGKRFTVKLYDDMFSVIPLLEGKFTPTADQQASMTYSYNVTLSKSEQTLPNKPMEGEQLHILLFGHSFGNDCMGYLPAITKAAGVNDVHYGRFYQSDCSMSQHWNHWTEEDTYVYYNSVAGSGKWSSSSRSSKSVVAETPWDIIIFQTSITSKKEGTYSTFKDPLRNMVNEVVAMCEEKHHKTPIIGWNMFWGFNYPYTIEGVIRSDDINATKEYNAIVSATKEMLADNKDVSLVIPTGTAVQNVRGTSLHDTTCMQQLTRDGFHIGYGFGRYVTACTWFQSIIAPIYGISVESCDSYLPTGKDTYVDYGNGVTDKVTTANRPILWKCAKAAVAHPFEVTKIQE